MTAPVPASLPAGGPLDGLLAAPLTTGVSARDLAVGFGDTLTSCLTAAHDQALAASSPTPVAIAGRDERAALIQSPGALLAAVAAVAAATAPDGDPAPPDAAAVDDVVTGPLPAEHDGTSDATDVTAGQPGASTAVVSAPPAPTSTSSRQEHVQVTAPARVGTNDTAGADPQLAPTASPSNERGAQLAPPSAAPEPMSRAGNATGPSDSVISATPTGMPDPAVSGPSGPEAPPVPSEQSDRSPSLPSDRPGAVARAVRAEASRRGRPVADVSPASGSTRPAVAEPDGTPADATASAAPSTPGHTADAVTRPGTEDGTTAPARSAVESGVPADTGVAAEPTAPQARPAAPGADPAASAVTPAPTTRRGAASPQPAIAPPEATGSEGDGAAVVVQPLTSAPSPTPPEQASNDRPAPAPVAASRILELVERLRHEPPPRQMVVDLASFGVGRLVVSLRGDTVVVGPAQTDAALDPQWLRDLGQALDARGWSLDERGGQPSHGRGRRPMPRWDLPHRIDRAGVDDALRL